MRALLLSLLTLVAACTSVNKTTDHPWSVRLIEVNTVEFRGEISDEPVRELELMLEQQASAAVDRLVISSPGGHALAGLRIGRLVHQRQLRVVVDRVCASSCANYVITASHDVSVRPGAIVGWHGGASQWFYIRPRNETSWLRRIYMFLAGIDRRGPEPAFGCRWLDEEMQFFDSIGVEQAVTVLGLMPGYSEQRRTELFAYDNATLATLGLNIHFHEPPAQYIGHGTKVLQIFDIDPTELEHMLDSHRALVNKKLSRCVDGTGFTS